MSKEKYSHFEKEILACTWSIQHFHNYLYGSRFVLHSDNIPVIRILQNCKVAPNARVERLLLRVQPYEFNIEYQKGEQNPSDYLSRHPCNDENESGRLDPVEQYVNFCINNSLPKTITLKQVQEETQKDVTMNLLKEALMGNKEGVWAVPEIKPFNKIKEEITYEQGIFLRNRDRIIIPKSLQENVINLAHKGHLGIIKTKQILRTKVWFPNLDVLTEAFVKTCSVCQAVTKSEQRNPIVSSPTPNYPFQRVDVDFAGPFRNKIVKSTSFQSILPVLNNIFTSFGYPETLKSDNGPPFNSRDFKQFLDDCGIKHTRVTPYWPEANGLAERFVKTCKKALLCTHLETGNFDAKIQEFLVSYRSAPHASTKISPFEAVFKRRMNNYIPQIRQNNEDNREIKITDMRSKEKQKRRICTLQTNEKRQLNSTL
ncbi:hypothetical protein ABEB36_015553 [Hypothenemus hampei]|uniref:RNA-directed DNA polymerase n=2 Tax=Hypothenemus hampei TaxID=57062 RepID=A0ABD1DZS5_HYPHA